MKQAHARKWPYLVLFLGISLIATVCSAQTIPLRGPPLASRPPNIVVTDVATGSILFSIQDKVLAEEADRHCSVGRQLTRGGNWVPVPPHEIAAWSPGTNPSQPVVLRNIH